MIKKIMLGKSQVEVSRLAFGTLTVSPLQKGFSALRVQALLIAAYEMGITFFDTAQLYGTYAPLKGLLKRHPEAVISTKSYAYDKKAAQEAFEDARTALDKDVIDVFMLHEQESPLTLKGHREAFDFYLNEKAKGRIRAVGMSTHRVAAADYAPRYPGLDVIHPLINLTGVGIADGTRDEMAAAIGRAHQAGIGIFAMKPLGGGHLIQSQKAAFDYLFSLGTIDSIAVGMQSEEEIAVNAAYFEGLAPPEGSLLECLSQQRRLLIHDWCVGCGNCEKRCGQDAIHVIGGQAVVDHVKCVRCGYCAQSCPEFCIKVV